MKKMIALAMAMTMGLSLVACGSSDTAASTDTAAETTEAADTADGSTVCRRILHDRYLPAGTA